MKRNLQALSSGKFDLLVVGGGIYGAAIAWEAASRGLKVALVEKKDFGSQTSANSLKLIHGGLRYLQHGDFRRLRQSARERLIWMQIAPHLVHPLPSLLPTYTHGLQRKEILKAAFVVNDLLTLDRVRIHDKQKKIGRGRIISREQCLAIAPGINAKGLTGGAVYYDAQVYNSERLVLALVHSASDNGAVAANYVSAQKLIQRNGRVIGATLRDEISGESFEVSAGLTVNAAGPWQQEIIASSGFESQEDRKYAQAFNVVTRRFFDGYAVGVSTRDEYHDPDVLFGRKSRLFFIAPWREYSLFGTEYKPYTGDPDDAKVELSDVEKFIDQVNRALPSMRLKVSDVKFIHQGLLPIDGIDIRTGSVQVKKHYDIIDHGRIGKEGFISVTGVKYTTARNVAEKVLDLVLRKLRRRHVSSPTPFKRIWGGEIDYFEAFVENEKRTVGLRLTEMSVKELILNYGTKYREILEYAGPGHLDRSQVLSAQVAFAVNDEMAMHLEDVVLRRTDIGSAGYPGSADVNLCARVMGDIMGWDSRRIWEEEARVKSIYPEWSTQSSEVIES